MDVCETAVVDKRRRIHRHHLSDLRSRGFTARPRSPTQSSSRTTSLSSLLFAPTSEQREAHPRQRCLQGRAKNPQELPRMPLFAMFGCGGIVEAGRREMFLWSATGLGLAGKGEGGPPRITQQREETASCGPRPDHASFSWYVCVSW
jgi:hypothetical protein